MFAQTTDQVSTTSRLDISVKLIVAQAHNNLFVNCLSNLTETKTIRQNSLVIFLTKTIRQNSLVIFLTETGTASLDPVLYRFVGGQ